MRSKKEFKKKLCNFTVQMGPDQGTIIYRDRAMKEHEIQFKKTALNGLTIYCYEDMKTENLYELIVKTNLFITIFGSYSLHHFVAVTKEALKLPHYEQPWFFGSISQTEVTALASGTSSKILFGQRLVKHHRTPKFAANR